MNDAKPSRSMSDYFRAALACVAATLLTLPLHGLVDAVNIAMIFVLVVALVAVWLGSGPAILAAFGGVALFDFFFVEPRFSMVVADAQYLITFAVMLVVALVIGQLAARLRDKALLAARREDEMRALYGMAKLLSGAVAAEQVADIVRDFLGSRLEIEAVLYLPDRDDALAAIPVRRGGDQHQEHVRAVYEQGRPMHLAAEESGYAPALALPLVSSVRTRGALLVYSDHAERFCAAEKRPLLDAVASLAAIAVERLHYGEVVQEVTLSMESERLRSALLSAVSHDLRTPLTVLVGMADALTLARPSLPPPALELATAIRDQALRLSGLVHNLLDMARLHTGKIVLNREWQPLEEVVGSSLKAMTGCWRDVRCASNWRRTCRRWSSTPCCWSGCSATCWRTPRNTRRGGRSSSPRRWRRGRRSGRGRCRTGLAAGRRGKRVRPVRARTPLGRRRRPWTGDLPRHCRGTWRPHPGGAARGRRNPDDFHAAARYAAGAGGGSR
jgi:two-component system sensor histidine kinase KdpD